MIIQYLYSAAIILVLVFSATGFCLGQMIAFKGFLSGAHRQPALSKSLIKLLFIGLFSIELSFLLTVVTAIILAMKNVNSDPTASSILVIGIALGMGISAIAGCLAIGRMMQSVVYNFAKHPGEEKTFTLLTAVLSTFIESPVLFTFVLALFGAGKLTPVLTTAEALQTVGAVWATTLGALGSAIAQSMFAPIGFNLLFFQPQISAVIKKTIMVIQAMLEICVLFTFLIGITFFFSEVRDQSIFFGKFIAVPFCVGVGGFAAATGISWIGQKSLKSMTLQPLQAGSFFSNTLPTLFFIETSSILSFIISLLLIKIF